MTTTAAETMDRTNGTKHTPRDATSASAAKRQETAIPIPASPITTAKDNHHPEQPVSKSSDVTGAADPTAPIEVVSESAAMGSTQPIRRIGSSSDPGSKKRRGQWRNDRTRMCGVPYTLCLVSSIIYSIIRVTGILVQNMYHVPTYLFFTWVFLYPIYFFRPSLFNWIENWLYSVCLYTVGSWSWLAGIQVVECGDDLYRIRECPTGVDYATGGNNNRFSDSNNVTQTTSPDSTDRRVSDAAQNQNQQQHNNQLQHHNSVNHMMNQMSKDQQLSSMDRISALIEMPSPVVDSSNPSETCKGMHTLTSPASSPLHVGRKFKRANSLDSVAGSDMSSSMSRGRILLMANHQSTSDVPLMFQAFVAKAKYVLLWVMDYQFKYTHFGIISGTHGDYFITPKTFVKNELTKHCLSNPDKDLIILFPEGGFRYKRIDSSKSYAQKRGWPVLQHLTWPRTGAFLDLTEGSLDISHIVDMTILYPSQEKTTWILDILLGRHPQQIYFHYRIFEVTPDGIYNEDWLNERWLEKENLMHSFYENPDEFLRTKAGVLRPIQMSYLKLLVNNILMMMGFCVVYVVIKFLVSVII